jgi:low affinity Fe/Cu permease
MAPQLRSFSCIIASTTTQREAMPNKDKPSNLSRAFSRSASTIATATGKPAGFALAVAVIVLWAATGPIFAYSDTWQLIINTGTTIVTFLMVFIIQNSQNRDGAAIQVKLDELIRVSAAKNFFVGIEHLTDEEIDRLRTMCEDRAKGANRLVAAVDKKATDAADRAG